MFDNKNNTTLPSRQRLNEISHHFMDATPTISKTRRTPFFLPVLIDEAGHKDMVVALNAELNKRGQSSCILNVKDIHQNLKNNNFLLDEDCWSEPFGDIGDQDTARIECDITRKYIMDNYEEDVFLLPYIFSQSFVPVLFSRALIIVSSTLNDVRSAYGDIKHLNEHSVAFIEIVMTYVEDVDKSSQMFLKLKQGAKKFLDLNIYNNGFLKINNHQSEDSGIIDGEIEGIATSVIQRWGLEKDTA